MALTDIIKPRGLCQLGYIKIGGLGAPRATRDGKGSWRPPRKDDFFTIRSMTRDKAGDLMPDERLMAELAKHADSDGKLRQLPVILLSDNIEEVMQSAWVWYAGKTKLVARCDDGKNCTLYLDPANGFRPLQTPQIHDWNKIVASPLAGADKFKLYTVFNCTIASSESRWGGVYKFRTTSKISADQILSSLMEISRATGGHLAGFPLWMVLRPMNVAPNGTPSVVYVVHLEIRGADLLSIQRQALQVAEARLTNAKQIQWIDREYRRLLTAPGLEPEEDRAEIVEEFHSEHGGESPSANGSDDPLLLEQSPAEDDPMERERQSSVTAIRELIAKAATATDAEQVRRTIDERGDVLTMLDAEQLMDLLRAKEETWQKAGAAR